MTQNMNTVRYIRIIFITLALYMGVASEGMAQTSSCAESGCAFSIATTDIKITPSGKGTVTVESIVHNTTEGEHNGEHTVTIVVEPVEGYCLKIGDIRVRKLVAPSSLPTPARAIVPEIADDLTVNGPNLVINSTSPANRKFTFIVPSGYDGAYIEAEFKDINEMYDGVIITEGGISYEANGHYILLDDVDVSTSGGAIFGTQSGAFTGTFEGVAKDDGSYPKIKGLTSALFDIVEGGTVKNIVLDDVEISSGSTTVTVGSESKTAAGAIANVAKGAARIYNCGIQATGSTVKTNDDGYTEITSCSSYVGSNANYVGGLVGLLDETARVINCYSYADITGGTTVGGIVGYNNGTTTSANNNQNTMVMNCMFYGNITSGNKAPIYNGKIISNAGSTGVGNYNYFYSEASYAESLDIQTPNCALMAEGRFLQRFEFFRHLLNSHLELAGWWATDAYDKIEMAKWVLEPSQIGSSTPYPILKKPGRYHSVVNIDNLDEANHRSNTIGTSKGTLTVNIQMGDGAVYQRPSGAAITTSRLSLNITDKDPDHFNFNYHKVQLPYYNDVGTKNYNGNRVVTGWKIVSIEGGTPGTFTASDSWGGYNFADRNCTNKDLYGTGGSNRIFNQGAYWDVPEGVTSITIEPYWAKCVYLADPNADKVYNTVMETGYNVPRVGGGQIYTNGNSYSIAGESQVVYTTMGDAISSSNTTGLYVGIVGDANNHSVYDYAVVLVGNYHHLNSIEASKAKPYTVTSIDLDGDNEPDYSYILRFNSRTECHPVRTDFINIPGLGMAQKSNGGTGSYNFGILIPKGWFEGTNTSLFRFTQFEYENQARSETDALILQGGVMEQWVSYNQKGRSNKIPYIHVGGNVWFKEFHTGCHQDKNQLSGDKRFQPTKHSPISVTGGDFDEFYLTGLYVANAGLDNYADNAECYINGGHFGTVCGAAMEGIGKANGADNTGDITWLIQNADIREFYAGGLNAAKPVTGNLSTTIIDSHVDIFCGGPKFGDMSSGKTVITNATGCTFGTFFGAGYGGNSYSRYAPSNQNNVTNIDWNTWVSGQYTRSYNATYGGVSTRFVYQFLPMSDNKTNVARILIDFVKFSLATTHSVTSTLERCTIENNFYGGGNLGKVDGNVTSTLTDCTVNGSVFGAGYSASLPTVEVDNIGFETEPYYYTDFGTYRKGVKGATTTYTWKEKTGDSWVDNTNHFLYTTEDLTTLGAVTGKATLTINGTTTVAESVYGGGEESSVGGDTEVTVNNGTIGTQGQGATDGNVYGGGMGKFKDEDDNELEPSKAVELGLVKGNTNVTIAGGEIKHNVYGGGAFGSVGTYTYATDNSGKITGYTSGGTANVTITGGTIGTDGINNGMVFGSSRGDIDEPGSIHDRLAWVHDTHVIIGTSGQGTTVNTPLIKGSVYGSGENGHTYQNTVVDVHSGTIGIASGDDVTVTNSDNTTTSYKAYNYPYRGNVYGGGCGTDKYYENKTGVSNPYDGNGQLYNPLAGIVQGSATVNIDGGHVVHNVYGAGAMGSVGTITNFDNLDDNYKHSTTKEDGAFYDFGLSWPYEFTYDNTTGLTQVAIEGSGVIGVSETDAKGGHVYGAARGAVDVGTNDITEQRYVEAKLANVRETQVTIGTANGTTTTPTIYGSVYGGGEDGHVYDNATVTIHHGRINHSVFGGGKGESTYNTTLLDATPGNTQGQEKATAEPVHSWTAGKVYGNTTVTMNGGSVGYNIYGGGNLASVGKGNYAGGADDYMTVGYGELPAKNGDEEGNLWTGSTTAGTYPYYFANSGKATVTINGGKVGVTAEGTHTGTDSDDNPYGNVFGSSRGKAALNVGQLSPRYRYVPDFFLGYVNETEVTIGGTGEGNGPEIYGSVYGGGQDGHVRRDTKVTVNKCTIGHTDNSHTAAEIEKIGNVFGAGSGLGQYTKGSSLYYNNSSGSVTCTTTVEVNNNATILGNVYGGGALASVGPPNIGSGDEQKEVTSSSTHQSVSFTQVDINGGNIGGNVYGASRGGLNLNYNGEDPNTYATDLYSTVNVSGGQIAGDVFGGGEAGQTKCDVEVNISGGIITKDVYGGGALAHTNTSNWVYNRTTGVWGDTWADGMTSTDTNGKTFTTYTTTVNLTGGQLRNAYGGGLGIHDVGEEGKTGYVEGTPAYVYGDVTVKLNEGVTLTNASSKKGCIVEKVFGCNNLKGTPKGHVQVYVYATQHKNQDKVVPTGGKYTKFGNLDNYTISNYSTYTFPTEGGKTLSQLATSVGINTEEAPFSTYVTTLSGSGTEADKKKALANMIEAIGKEKYDVQAVYGGGNLAPYDPVDAYSTNANTKASARTEVYIEGCELTSIKQVYAGGNAAPAPATLVQVYGTYEIEEVFGGGNGKDNYTLNNGTEDEWFVNPGANVGYRNYTHLDGNGSGTELSPYSCADNTNAATKEQRRATYMYGSGVATTEIYGGRIHYVYGGSNEKGNISEEAVSVYEEETGTGSCTMDLDQTYGGGKNSIIDGRIDMGLGCVQNMAETFGGSKNADVNSDIVLNITNGTYGRVFGGNNTSGNINGSITVNIYEDGCSPIRIGDLYLGGYLAGYSIYGYKADGSVRTKDEFEAEKADALTGVDETDEEAVEEALLEAGLSGLPRQDPRINIISATRIDNIFGGGYEATVVGSPHVNVNMEQGRIRSKYVVNTTEDPFVATHTDDEGRENYDWTGESIDTDGNGILAIGTIGTIYGGGNLADIIGDTYVEIGTGRWVSSWDDNGPVYETEDANGDKYTYKIKTPAVKYSSAECSTNNASLPTISTSTSLTAAQATRLNELLSINTYSAGGSPSSEHAEAYNGTLDGYITTADIKTPAVWAWYTKVGDNYVETSSVPTPVRNAATITGDVFGGGQGLADATTFTCEKAMVGVDGEGADPTKRNGGTSVVIENGTVSGSVYGGGRLARVEKNTVVTIGSESGIGSAVIEGDVYGAGMGVDTHGYSGLVRGNATVTIQDDSKVKGNVYGGGQKASLGRFFVATTPALATLHHVEQGMPYDLKSGGTSTVVVRGRAQIGRDSGTANGNVGHVFGAGKGTLPGENSSPKRYYISNNVITEQSYVQNSEGHLKYIETLGITNKTNVTTDGSATVKGSVYGGSMSGFVRTTTDVNIQNGTINGDVFGGGLGSTTFSEAGRVSGNTEVTISNGAVGGNVYGGGSLGDVGTITKEFVNYNYTWTQTDGTTANVAEYNKPSSSTHDTSKNTGICTVTIEGGTIGSSTEGTGNVFGAGKGSDDTWWCEKATVFATNVSIKNTGTVVYGNVYGGGQIGRVEDDAKVTIGTASGTDEPDIKGNVFGAGAGLETHGYSALVRGNSTVIVQGKASVEQNVYGGGEKATVGRYWVKTPTLVEGQPNPPEGLEIGLPYATRSGGECIVTIQNEAVIGPEEGTATETAGHVFGAGKGVGPDIYGKWAYTEGDKSTMPYRMTTDPGEGKRPTYYDDLGAGLIKEYYPTLTDYLKFLETLGLATDTYVTIHGATVKGTVYGGSESGFVQNDAQVTIEAGVIGTEGTTTYGNVFGGGKGLDTFAEAGRVRGNTTVEISGGTMYGSVYGGGELGDVGTINKEDPGKNYKWTNALGQLGEEYTYNNTGKCDVTISGASTTVKGNVFGAGKGKDDTFECEKAMAYKANVSIESGTVEKNVYGGGEIGRVENNTQVTIGKEDATQGTEAPVIEGTVFGAGAGKETHGYSALVRGNANVIIQGNAWVKHNVYGGGELASVGRYCVNTPSRVDGQPDPPLGLPIGMPYATRNGGECEVTIQDNAKIGTDNASDDAGYVFGAGKGVEPRHFIGVDTYQNKADMPWRMTTDPGEGKRPAYCDVLDNGAIKEYYATKDKYYEFLETLALTTNTNVTISDEVAVMGTVFGGGQRGITRGSVVVNITGGTVGTVVDGELKEETGHVYGGGALANTNTNNWNPYEYVEIENLTSGASAVNGYYTRTGSGTEASPYVYTLTTDETAVEGKHYYSKGNWVTGIFNSTTHETANNTTVTLTGGVIEGDVYGGGLGRKEGDEETPAQGEVGEDGYVPAGTVHIEPVEAKVFGDVLVTLNKNGTAEDGDNCVVKGSIFGCNNENGSPQNAVTVHIYKTQGYEGHWRTAKDLTGDNAAAALDDPDDTHHTYELLAVYGGGNQAAFKPDLQATCDTVQPRVIIDGCDLTSIKTVYGGGNAASVPATNVRVNAAYEIEEVFGGGNGYGKMPDGSDNPGANVGYTYYDPQYDPPASSKTERTNLFSYGSGKANVDIIGGRIHRVFGGSNTKGNVRESAVTILQDLKGCVFSIDEAYGGGKNAPMDAEAKLMMACIPGLKAAYGGAQDADIQDDVTLTITNGTFDRVFGGNNVSGKIHGTITVNIEETGCQPLIIGQLYGGGNQALYEAPEGKPGPTLNVKSFTSIGDIYGGGYGETAVVRGDTHVNINVCKGKYASTAFAEQPNKIITFMEYKRKKDGVGEESFEHDENGDRILEQKVIGVFLPGHDGDKIGAINNVYGGGNAAKVEGSTFVNIGTKDYVSVASAVEGTDVSDLFIRTGEGTDASPYVYTSATAARQGVTYCAKDADTGEYSVVNSFNVGDDMSNYYIRTGGGTTESPYVYTLASLAEDGTAYYMPVIGVDIRGNVYGGGNAADVTNNTNVVIGKETATP